MRAALISHWLEGMPYRVSTKSHRISFMPRFLPGRCCGLNCESSRRRLGRPQVAKLRRQRVSHFSTCHEKFGCYRVGKEHTTKNVPQIIRANQGFSLKGLTAERRNSLHWARVASPICCNRCSIRLSQGLYRAAVQHKLSDNGKGMPLVSNPAKSQGQRPERKDHRIIIHFDYDCFYASVFEAENPTLRSLPLAVQQKQIIVTCNYEARRRGLRKLQLITEAKQICPEVIIVLGEDISRFRDVSKALYSYLRDHSWNGQVERLGFDEVWMDVTDLVNFNIDVLNKNDLANCFFNLKRDDPTVGFRFDASQWAGHMYPPEAENASKVDGCDMDPLTLGLRLGSHLAMHLRHLLESERGFTSTVGISTSKVLSKLVGNLNKPRGQTTLIPPYEDTYAEDFPGEGNEDEATTEPVESNVTKFIDSHEIGKLPGIGFKLAQKLREYVLQRPAAFEEGLVYGKSKEIVYVRDVRLAPGVSAEVLDKILAGPNQPHGIGFRIWQLIHGVDNEEVKDASPVPKQISIEDSYIRLDTFDQVLRELHMLTCSLIKRMHVDLMEHDSDDPTDFTDEAGRVKDVKGKRWLAYPKTLRLSTRPRPPLQPDGTRSRSFQRISRSTALPSFIFSLNVQLEALADRLVKDALLPLFRKLHPEKSGWNLSLVNIAVTDMDMAAGEGKTSGGRDLVHMWAHQEETLKDFRVHETDDKDLAITHGNTNEQAMNNVDNKMNDEILGKSSQDDPAFNIDNDDGFMAELDEFDPEENGMDLDALASSGLEEVDWSEEAEMPLQGSQCPTCGIEMPPFAMAAHQRFHQLGD